MSDLVLFKPRREFDAQQNVVAFVALCRDELTVFGADLPFDEMAWDLRGYIHLKGKDHAVRAVFSSWETVNDASPAPMKEPFQSFAKAYFRYQHSLRPTKVIGSRIAAVRALGAALSEMGTSEPSAADSRSLNRAAQLVKAKFSNGVAYRVGQQLGMLASFIDDNRLAVVPLRWRNSLPRPTDTIGRVGEDFDALREEKLPSPYELDSLARAYRAATEPTDQFVTGVAAVMCSAPDRVNEILGLRAACEVHSDRPNEPAAYGLRFWPSKGADPMVKWVVPSMASVVQEALGRLRDISAEARKLAAWYQANPASLYLPAHLEKLRGQDLSMPQLGQVLFEEEVDRSVPRQWCETNDVPSERRGKRLFVRFSDVEHAVLAALPHGFPVLDPETGLLFSEALCIARRNELNRTKTTFRCILEAVTQDFIATGLGNRSEFGFKSVFENLGLLHPDGSPIAIRTHQFRHYLSTLAHSGGMSEFDIAKWAGRKDIRQNSAYNHVSDRDTQAQLVELRQAALGQTSTDVAPQVRISLIPRAKFKELGIQAAHTTDFGMCVHDFAMAPCQLHLDCTNCNEQVCVKGDAVGEANARAKLSETDFLLAEAGKASVDGFYGAGRWLEHQRLTQARLSELVAILDNPAVPHGALIRLTRIESASRLKHAAEARTRALGVEPVLRWLVVEDGVAT